MGKMKQFGGSVTRLINKEDIPRGEMRDIFSMILRDETTEMHQGAFTAAAKGETAEEIAGVWEAICDIDTVKAVPDVNDILVDNCGTGMDAVKTFNISTAASIIAAADGINIARHGARAITSVCGTVDILETLGVDVECPPQYVKNSIEQTGIGIYNGMSPQGFIRRHWEEYCPSWHLATFSIFQLLWPIQRCPSTWSSRRILA